MGRKERIAEKALELWMNKWHPQRRATTMLHDPHLAKKMEVEDVDIHLVAKGVPGSYDFPAEATEVEVKHAILGIHDLTIDEAERLPMHFDVQKSHSYELDDGEVVDLVLTFDVQVKSKKPIKNNMVEIEFTDSLKAWDYY